jgi:hypothetical protein
MEDLGFLESDLEGTYFSEECFSIGSVGDDGNISVAVDASKSTKSNPPTGTKTLSVDGDWN